MCIGTWMSVIGGCVNMCEWKSVSVYVYGCVYMSVDGCEWFCVCVRVCRWAVRWVAGKVRKGKEW